MDAVIELLNQQGITQLGFEQGDVSYGDFLSYQAALPGIELLPTAKLVEGIRMVKDDAELQIMQEAADLADQTFSHILSYIKPGVKELDIALEIEMFIRKTAAHRLRSKRSWLPANVPLCLMAKQVIACSK